MFCTSAGIHKDLVGYLNSTTLFIGAVVNQIFSWGVWEKNEESGNKLREPTCFITTAVIRMAECSSTFSINEQRRSKLLRLEKHQQGTKMLRFLFTAATEGDAQTDKILFIKILFISSY
jgi:hypothetical protein